MKHALFLFTASILFLACSNDDDNPSPEQQEEEQTEFKIQRFFRVMESQSEDYYALEHLFDETGKLTNFTETFDDSPFRDDYNYNNLDGITQRQTINVNQSSIIRTIPFEYDASNKISSITYTSPPPSGMTNTIHFSYQGNTVYTEDDFGSTASYTFDANGKLIQTVTASFEMRNGITTETITYSGDQITAIYYENRVEDVMKWWETYSFEYDDKTNPLYENFNNYLDNYIYGFVGGMSSFKFHFSPNNLTKVEYTHSDSSRNYTDIFTNHYNEQDFPINAKVKRNGVLLEELTYEYY